MPRRKLASASLLTPRCDYNNSTSLSDEDDFYREHGSRGCRVLYIVVELLSRQWFAFDHHNADPSKRENQQPKARACVDQRAQ